MRISIILNNIKNNNIKIKDIINNKYKFISYSYFHKNNISKLSNIKKYRKKQIKNFLEYTRKSY